MSVRRAAAVEAPLVPDRLRTVLRLGLEHQKRNNWTVCRGCGPKTDAYYTKHSLAVDDKNVDEARKTGVDWEDDARCIICLDLLAGLAGGVDVEDESVEALVENVTVKRCNHVFHTACLKQWIQRSKRNCPLCQTPLDFEVVLRLQYGHSGDRLVRTERPDGAVDYLVGPTGEERKVCTKRPGWRSGTLQYYKGRQGEERKVRTEFASGIVAYYDGPKDEERMVRRELPYGRVVYYDGPKDEECKVRVELPDGTVDYYEGPTFTERLVRRELPDGTVEYYEGSTGTERLVRTELAGDMLPRVEDLDAHA